MAVLNSDPEILLRKRKNADRKRLDKQQEDLERQAKKARLSRKRKFVRAETLVSNHKSNELERKRIRALTSKQERLVAKNTLKTSAEYRLLFVIRVPNHTKGLTIPPKARQVLQVLKLTEINTGVFVKASETTMALLSLVAPYVIIGEPSISSIRKLFQKRARIKGEPAIESQDLAAPALGKIPGQSPADITDQERQNTVYEADAAEAKCSIKLDNNQVVEDKFGDSLGLVCVEDIIHEIVSLSSNFSAITAWLLPFQLNPPVHGWGPVAKLAKLVHAKKNVTKISLSQDFRVQFVDDIDGVIDQQN